MTHSRQRLLSLSAANAEARHAALDIANGASDRAFWGATGDETRAARVKDLLPALGIKLDEKGVPADDAGRARAAPEPAPGMPPTASGKRLASISASSAFQSSDLLGDKHRVP